MLRTAAPRTEGDPLAPARTVEQGLPEQAEVRGEAQLPRHLAELPEEQEPNGFTVSWKAGPKSAPDSVLTPKMYMKQEVCSSKCMKHHETLSCVSKRV